VTRGQVRAFLYIKKGKTDKLLIFMKPTGKKFSGFGNKRVDTGKKIIAIFSDYGKNLIIFIPISTKGFADTGNI